MGYTIPYLGRAVKKKLFFFIQFPVLPVCISREYSFCQTNVPKPSSVFPQILYGPAHIFQRLFFGFGRGLLPLVVSSYRCWLNKKPRYRLQNSFFLAFFSVFIMFPNIHSNNLPQSHIRGLCHSIADWSHRATNIIESNRNNPYCLLSRQSINPLFYSI